MSELSRTSKKITLDSQYEYRIAYPSDKYKAYIVQQRLVGDNNWERVYKGCSDHYLFDKYEDALDYLKKTREERRAIVVYEEFY